MASRKMFLASVHIQHQSYLQVLVCSERCVRPCWWVLFTSIFMRRSLSFLVMALPLSMVWGIQLRKSQKLALAGIFSLGSVVAIFDILRTVESLKSGTFSGVALWSSLEVTMAVIVASLPLYRALLSRKRRQSLISHVRIGHYKTMNDIQTTVDRKSSDDRSSRPDQPSVGTYREYLETQLLVSPHRARQGQHFPLAHLSR